MALKKLCVLSGLCVKLSQYFSKKNHFSHFPPKYIFAHGNKKFSPR